MTTSRFQLRWVAEQEFVPRARMIADTCGPDRPEEEPADQRAATDLARPLAVFDEGEPVAGTSLYSRMPTVPGGVLPVAEIASVGVARRIAATASSPR